MAHYVDTKTHEGEQNQNLNNNESKLIIWWLRNNNLSDAIPSFEKEDITLYELLSMGGWEKKSLLRQYLEDIKGFISIKNIFHLCRLRSMRFMFKDPILNINKEDIDLIISSNPLSLKKKGNKSADLIPVSYTHLRAHET